MAWMKTIIVPYKVNYFSLNNQLADNINILGTTEARILDDNFIPSVLNNGFTLDILNHLEIEH